MIFVTTLEINIFSEKDPVLFLLHDLNKKKYTKTEANTKCFTIMYCCVKYNVKCIELLITLYFYEYCIKVGLFYFCRASSL